MAPGTVTWFQGIRLDRNEVAGSLGDLGTFIVFLIGFSSLTDMDPSAILVFAGLMNILTGFLFRIPMAVQPMKAIGVIAISSGMTGEYVIAAGILMGVALTLLSVSGAVSLMMRYIPRCVTRGIQLGLGLIFLKLGVGLILATGGWLAPDGYIVAIILLGLAFVLFDSRRIPSSIIIFLVGGAMVFIINGWGALAGSGTPGIYVPRLMLPSGEAYAGAFGTLVIPQLALTLVNSVVAVCALAASYFPERRRQLSGKNVALAVGAMNLVSCPFGGMPMCHGAGGLAGQYRFGARTGGSVILLGTAKLLAGLLFGGAVLAFSRSFPLSVIGTMIIVSGVELASHVRDVHRSREVFIAVMVSGVSLVLNTAAGLIAGLALYYLWKAKRSMRAPPENRPSGKMRRTHITDPAP